MKSLARRGGGFTLIELCASLTTMVLVFGTVGFLLHRSVEGTAESTGYASDLRGLRGAFASIEADLRSAREVRIEEGLVEVRTEKGVIRYHLDRAGLVREEGESVRHWLSIGGFDCEREGELVRYSLTLRPRRAPASAVPLILSSAVHLRRRP